MLDKTTVKQLNSCHIAKIPQFDENHTHLLIQKSSPDSSPNLCLNSCYLCELNDEIFTDNEFVNKWNNGQTVKSKYVQLVPTVFLGDMVKVDGIGFNVELDSPKDDIYLSYWLPSKYIKVIRSIE